MLDIRGTDSSDTIIVGLNKRFVNVLSVYVNDDVSHFPLSVIQSVGIRSFGGDDKIWIDSALDPLTIRAFIDAGTGDDMVTTGAGADVVYAGPGDDKIYTNGGDDLVHGDDGNDSIWGASGNDTLDGGAGNGLLCGEAGDDLIIGSSGNDRLYGADGNDLFRDSSGRIFLDAGAGSDSGSIATPGIIYAGAGDDTFTATGAAYLYGQGGEDTLQGSWADGGEGDDVVSGLLGNDELHGGAGDDLIRGFSGNDTLLGDDGDDAIFGGIDTDTIYGGTGNDNLYGTDGYQDKHRNQGGRDIAYGGDGADWFETGYKWGWTDRSDRFDAPPETQNYLYQDPSYQHYDSNGPTYASSVTTNINDLHAKKAYTVGISTRPVGDAGWLSSGGYDVSTGAFDPPSLTSDQKSSTHLGVVQLPPGWGVDGTTTSAGEMTWYRLRSSGEKPIVPQNTDGTWSIANTRVETTEPGYKPSATNGKEIPLEATDGLWRWVAYFDSNDLGKASATEVYRVPTIDGGSMVVPTDTPGLTDGADHGQWRFLGLRPGSVLISGAGNVITEPASWHLDTHMVAIPLDADVRVAGQSSIHHVSATIDTLPTGGPRKLRGILLDDGVIWLPTDGSGAYHS